MSQKTSYKARVQRELILAQFKGYVNEHNFLNALCIYEACTDIPPDVFENAWKECIPEPWTWGKVKRG